jgi:hypothetical protein
MTGARISAGNPDVRHEKSAGCYLERVQSIDELNTSVREHDANGALRKQCFAVLEQRFEVRFMSQ